MNQITIDEIVAATGGTLLRNGTETSVSAVKQDSRECRAGDLFVAIIGKNQDGHRYIPMALQQGCRTILLSHTGEWLQLQEAEDVNLIQVADTTIALGQLAKYYLSTLDVKKIAVTGSVGKTSVRDMIYYVLSEKYQCGRNLKNFNNEIGLPLSIFQFDDTTEAVVLEMGMNHFGEIDYLADIVKPHIAVITNVGMAHIENLGSREGIFQAKMEVVKHLTGEDPSDHEPGTLVYVCDDNMLTRETTAGNYRQVEIGRDGRSDYIISLVDDFGLEGIQFTLEHAHQSRRIALPVPGYHNAGNSALAIAVGGLLGVSIEQAVAGLAKTELTGRRLRIVKGAHLQIIDDTYNANPDSMKSALKVLSQSEKAHRKTAILGDMYELGEESSRQHFNVGVFARNLNIDQVIAIGNNARQIAEGAKGGTAEVAYFETKEKFFDAMKDWVVEDDIILVKASRGMQMEKIVEKLVLF